MHTQYEKLNSLRKSEGFWRENSGSLTIQLAMYLAIAAVGFALIAPQFMSSNSERLAASPAGIDRVTTGSISGKKRYVIRKSILDLEQAN